VTDSVAGAVIHSHSVADVLTYCIADAGTRNIADIMILLWCVS
jgi:hypothetical protein